MSTPKLKAAIKEIIVDSKPSLLASVAKVLEACQAADPLRAADRAAKDFEDWLKQWKVSIFKREAESEVKRKACEKLCDLCIAYIKNSGFIVNVGNGPCHPSVEKLRMSMEDLQTMIDQEDAVRDGDVCVKTFFIPSRRPKGSSLSANGYVDRVWRELENIAEIAKLNLSHNNIAKIFEVLPKAQVIGPDERPLGYTVCVVQELVDGGIDLFEWVQDWQESTAWGTRAALHHVGIARYFFRSLLDAVVALHQRNIFHYDIKIENIMVSTRNKTLKLIDFGLGKVLPMSNSFTRELSLDAPRVWYLAPEVRRGRQTVPGAADVWGCGVVLHALTIPKCKDHDIEDILMSTDASFDKVLEQCPEIQKHLSQGDEDGRALKDLLRRCERTEDAWGDSALPWDVPLWMHHIRVPVDYT